MTTTSEKPDCYACCHRRKVAGDAHSRCVHPSIGELSALDQLLGILKAPQITENIQRAADELDIMANYHGIKQGWFQWPTNFDPVWLKNCKGFTPKEEDSDSKT